MPVARRAVLKQQQRSTSWVYAGALRSELSARLGVSWGPVSEGHAEIGGVAEEPLRLFSQRSEQVQAKAAELIGARVDEHDGDEPDARTISRLERSAVLASRPGKQAAVEAESLRAEWTARARDEGFEALAVPDGQGRLPGSDTFDVDTVIAQALDAVSASSATWLRANLARGSPLSCRPGRARPQRRPWSWWTAWPKALPPAASSCTQSRLAASGAGGTAGR